MTWVHPAALWFLMLPLAGLVWTLLRPLRGSTDERWPKIIRLQSTMAGLKPAGDRLGTRTRATLMWLAVCLTIVALARPQWGQTEEQVYQRSREVLIALDLSRSMLVDDVAPSRLERSKLMIQGLLDVLEGERVGLIVFAGTAFLQSPLSADYQILRGFLPDLDPDYLPQGGTDYEKMLQTALNSFGQETNLADRFLIILSDGESLDGEWKPRANDLRDRSIRVLGLGVGTAPGGLVPDGRGGYMKDTQGAVVLSRLNDTTLRELASITGGVARNAAGWIDLGELIDETVEKGRAGQFLEDREVKRIERFQSFLVAAVLFALLSLWRELPSLPRFRRLRTTDIGKSRKSTMLTSARAVPFLLLFLNLSARSPAQSLVGPESPDPDPLKELVAGIIEKQKIEPAEWAAMARETITYAQALHETGQPVAKGTIADGLDAVDRGEEADPNAADWAALREALLRQLESPPQPDAQEQDKEGEQKNQEDQSRDQQQPSDQQNQDGDDPREDPQNQDSDPSDPQSRGGPEDRQQEQNQQEDAPEHQAETDPDPQDDQQMQKIGGNTSSARDLPDDPELAAAIQELERVKNQDSPARLFQILEGGPRPDTNTDRNW